MMSDNPGQHLSPLVSSGGKAMQVGDQQTHVLWRCPSANQPGVSGACPPSDQRTRPNRPADMSGNVRTPRAGNRPAMRVVSMPESLSIRASAGVSRPSLRPMRRISR